MNVVAVLKHKTTGRFFVSIEDEKTVTSTDVLEAEMFRLRVGYHPVELYSLLPIPDIGPEYEFANLSVFAEG